MKGFSAVHTEAALRLAGMVLMYQAVVSSQKQAGFTVTASECFSGKCISVP